MRPQQPTNIESHQYIIIGSGISGLQSAMILSQHNKDFLILQASQKIGGRISTDYLSNILHNQYKTQAQYPKWLTSSPLALNTPIQCGATWISNQHQYILKLFKQFKIKTFPQYCDGLSIYGKSVNQFQSVRSLGQHYKCHQNTIKNLFNKIQFLKSQYKSLQLTSKTSQAKKSQFHQFIDLYDTITTKDFITSELQNYQLVGQILNQFQMLQCISNDQFSMMQLFDDDSCLQNLKFYIGMIQNTIDGMRIQPGMITLINQMRNKMMRTLQSFRPLTKQSDIILLNTPVTKIQNHLHQPIKIHTKNSSKIYKCQTILFSVPIAVINQIQITGISPSKKLICQNQQNGTIHRLYLVFQHAFWRYKYTGYGSFNSSFPFNQLTDLSPSNLSCGILTFIFFANKYNKWIQQYPDPLIRINYIKNIVANMFLRGDMNSPYLQNCFSFTKTFSDHPYIRAGYQATTKPTIWKQVKDSGDDFNESYYRDENNLLYIGSEFGDQFCTFMQGAVRLSRKKTYKHLGLTDPCDHH